MFLICTPAGKNPSVLKFSELWNYNYFVITKPAPNPIEIIIMLWLNSMAVGISL